MNIKKIVKVGYLLGSLLFLLNINYANSQESVKVNPFNSATPQVEQVQSSSDSVEKKNPSKNESEIASKRLTNESYELSRTIYEPIQDYSNVLTKAEANALNARLTQFHDKYGGLDFVIILVKGTNNLPIDDFANQTFRKWKLGNKKKNNGLLLVVDTENRKYRTEVGYGLEGALPDGYVGRMSREILEPQFKVNKFYNGLNSYVSAIGLQLDKEKENSIPFISELSKAEQIGLAIVVVFLAIVFFSIFGIDGVFLILRIIILILTAGKVGIGGGGTSGGGGSSGKY